MATGPLFIVNQYSYCYGISGGGHDEDLERTESAIFTSEGLPAYIEEKVIEYSIELKMEVTPEEAKDLAAKIISLGHIITRECCKEEDGERTEILEIIKCNINRTAVNTCSLLDFELIPEIILSKMIENLREEAREIKSGLFFSVSEFRVRTAGYVRNSLGDISLINTGMYTRAVLHSIIESKIIEYAKNGGKIKVSETKAKNLAKEIIKLGSMTWQPWKDETNSQTFFIIIKQCQINKQMNTLDPDSLNEFEPACIKYLLRPKKTCAVISGCIDDFEAQSIQEEQVPS